MPENILKKMFYSMLRIRLVEEKLAELYSEQEMRCPVHLCTGQEAIATGVCTALDRTDYVLSSHRSHGHYLAKGGNLNAMIAEIYGKKTGCCAGKGGSMHLIDLESDFLGSVPILGSTIPIAVGVAFGSWMKNENSVTVAFFGDGAVEEGVLHESLNFALLKKLPVIFVCENNFFSVYSPLDVRQPERREISEIAKGHGVESSRGDGNNILEVYQKAKKAVVKARDGRGPVFLEFTTYRWREHCGPHFDNHIGYRTEDDFLKWKQLCPIERFKNHLISDSILSVQDIREIESILNREIDQAFVFAKASPFPESESASNQVYAN